MSAVLGGAVLLVSVILLAAVVERIAPDSVVAGLTGYASFAGIQVTYEGGAHIIVYEAASGFATAYVVSAIRGVSRLGRVIRFIAAWTAGWIAGGTIAGLFQLLPGVIPVVILSLLKISFRDDSLPVRIMDYGIWTGLIGLAGALGGLTAARILPFQESSLQRKRRRKMAVSWGIGWIIGMAAIDFLSIWSPGLELAPCCH